MPDLRRHDDWKKIREGREPGSHTSFHIILSPSCNDYHSNPHSYRHHHLPISSIAERGATMALQTPAGLKSTITPKKAIKTLLLLPSAGQAGLRMPLDRHALRSSFFSPSVQLLLSPPRDGAAAPGPRFSMRVASKQAYICQDCGYIYNERTPFGKLPDNYSCPVCAAPKRRFRPYQPAVAKNANQTGVRKARKAQIQRDEAIGKALPVAIALGVAGLAGLYFYLNSTF